MFSLGQIVRCVEKPGYIDGITRNNEYVVCQTMMRLGAQYITVLGDNNEGITLLATMFRPAST